MSDLVLQDVAVRFGGLQALSDISFEIRPGEIVGLIGPNGAGKTTVFNVVTGVYQPTKGAVTYAGESILKNRPHAILKRGIARTFQNIRLFPNMTALENAMVALHSRSSQGVLGAVLRTGHQKREEKEITGKAREALAFMGIDRYRDEIAKNLSYGLQRRLEIARALASQPKTILLDEPAAGMNPAESMALVKDISRIAEHGINILMVEHDMKVVMGVCQRIVVLDHGVLIAEGNPETIRRDPKVIEAYLGN